MNHNDKILEMTPSYQKLTHGKYEQRKNDGRVMGDGGLSPSEGPIKILFLKISTFMVHLSIINWFKIRIFLKRSL